jgi:hypothetical protein
MNALQKSIAAIGLGAALAFSVPAPVLADGAPYGRYAGPGHHAYHGPHWRAHRHDWRHRHRHGYHGHPVRTVERVVYEPAPASDPAIVISPNIQLGGGGGGSYDGGGVAPSSTLGTVVGAVAGAAVGSRIGKGKGNTAAIAIGSVVGGHIGGRLGAQ